MVTGEINHVDLTVSSLERTVIIGNSGAGKSVLAERLATLVHVPAIDLDLLHWEDDGFRRKRDEEVARRLVRDEAAAPRWIIEGVYGWLAEIAMPRATTLIWLDLPWTACRDGLLARRRRHGETDADLANLMAWCEDYWDRQTSSSFKGHSRLFEGFPGMKLRLNSREEVHQFQTTITASGIEPN